MVSVLSLLRRKSAAVAPVPAAAATVTVTAQLDGCESVAVTVNSPYASAVKVGANTSATVGTSSSSVVLTGTSSLSRPS